MTAALGMASASLSRMRSLLAVVILAGSLGGCISASGGAGGGSRPGVMPMLSELPTDPEKRDAILDQSAQAAGPEQRKGMTSKERKAETAAATAAAILGEIFSKTKSVTLGTASMFDEVPAAPTRPLPAKPQGPFGPTAPVAPGDADPNAPPADEATPNTDLIPWIKLK